MELAQRESHNDGLLAQGGEVGRVGDWQRGERGKEVWRDEERRKGGRAEGRKGGREANRQGGRAGEKRRG